MSSLTFSGENIEVALCKLLRSMGAKTAPHKLVGENIRAGLPSTIRLVDLISVRYLAQLMQPVIDHDDIFLASEGAEVCYVTLFFHTLSLERVGLSSAFLRHAAADPDYYLYARRSFYLHGDPADPHRRTHEQTMYMLALDETEQLYLESKTNKMVPGAKIYQNYLNASRR